MKSTKIKKYISFIELKDKSIIKGNIDIVNKWNFPDTDELNFSRELIIESYDKNEEIYNNFVNIFQKHLNRIHKTQYSIEYWELIIGPWLKLFIDVVRIKWQKILSLKLNDFDGVILLKGYKNFDFQFISQDRIDFKSFYESNIWDEYIQTKIILFLKKNKYKNIKIKYFTSNSKLSPSSNADLIENKFKRSAFKLINSIFLLMNNFKKKYFIMINNSYLGLFKSLILSKKIGFYPFFYYSQKNEIYPFKLDKSKRSMKYSKKVSLFEEFLLKIIFKQIPNLYIENWHIHNNYIEDFISMRDLKLIFSGSGMDHDDFFRRFVAQQKYNNKKIKLVITQHGCNFDTRVIPTKGEFFEKNVADYFISWGWSEKKRTNIIPGVNIKSRKINNNVNKNCNVLIVLPTNPKVPNDFQDASNISGQIYTFYTGLLSKLDDQIKKNITIRPAKLDRKSEYLRAIYKEYKFSTFQNIFNVYKNSKIIVCAANSTSFLECMCMNIPVVAIIPNYKDFFRNSAIKHFKQLEKVKLLFTDYKKASGFINKNYLNFDIHWNKAEVQKERKKFNRYYSKYSSDLPSFYSKILKQIIS